MDRLMDKVTIYEGHWKWKGSIDVSGYGRIGTKKGQSPLLVHRVVYEHYRGPIPEGHQIDHLCGMKACVNPTHLEAVLPIENAGRAMLGTCRNGHEYTPENTRIISTTGNRRCRECDRAADRRRREHSLAD